jgi:hypothetical protein
MAAVSKPRQSATRLRPYLLPIGLFLLGGGFSAALAHRLGAFEAPESTVDEFVQEAHAAIAVSAWDHPPGNNVKDITDSALKRWPGAEAIVAVRRDAARRLVLRAKQVADEDPRKAERYARLASELYPNDSEAAQLVSQFGAMAKAGPETAEPSTPAISEPAPAPSRQAEAPVLPPQKQTPKKTAAKRPAPTKKSPAGTEQAEERPAQSEPSSRTEPVEPASEPTKDPGRWL